MGLLGSFLTGALVAVDMLFAMAVFITFVRPDVVVALLARGRRMGSDWFADELDDAEIELLRAVVSRLRWVLLLAMVAVGFSVGALIMYLRTTLSVA